MHLDSCQPVLLLCVSLACFQPDLLLALLSQPCQRALLRLLPRTAGAASISGRCHASMAPGMRARSGFSTLLCVSILTARRPPSSVLPQFPSATVGSPVPSAGALVPAALGRCRPFQPAWRLQPGGRGWTAPPAAPSAEPQLPDGFEPALNKGGPVKVCCW